MSYSIPIEFEYISSAQLLREDKKSHIQLPPRTLIRIFGTVGSGKGTVSSMLSDFFSIPNFDTGKIWRTVAYGYQQEGLSNTPSNTDKIFDKVTARLHGTEFDLYFDGTKLSDSDLRNPGIDATVSDYSQHRNSYNTFLSRFLKQNTSSLVLDGRGGRTPYLVEAQKQGYTVVKIFLFVELEEAAHRRALDYQKKNPNEDFATLLHETKNKIIKRDYDDYNHIVDQNMGWVDSATHAIDTTNLTIEEVFETVLYKIHSSIERNASSKESS